MKNWLIAFGLIGASILTVLAVFALMFAIGELVSWVLVAAIIIGALLFGLAYAIKKDLDYYS